jgi:hypothetical protein
MCLFIAIRYKIYAVVDSNFSSHSSFVVLVVTATSDLAQILLREGDLQRMNGRYTSSIQDYASCLELRKQYMDKWDRKIADTQFNLGLTYLSSSSELQKEQTTAATTSEDSAAGDGAVAATTTTPNAEALAKEHCEKGITQHVECAKTFCGILAKLCGRDPEQFLMNALSYTTDPYVKPAGFKTTGLGSSTVAEASQTLNCLRKAVTTLVASNPPNDTVAANTVYDIQQVLDEIQETVDEAEQSLEGVRQASQIKVQAQKQAAALGGDDPTGTTTTCEDGITTSIGFGPPAASVAAAATATVSTNQPNMMVVKKKKRKDIDGDDQDTKQAAGAAEGDAKRTKTDS